MASTNVGSEQTGSTPDRIQEIIDSISALSKRLQLEAEAELDSSQQSTDGANATAADDDQQDGSSKTGDVAQEKNGVSNQKAEDGGQAEADSPEPTDGANATAADDDQQDGSSKTGGFEKENNDGSNQKAEDGSQVKGNETSNKKEEEDGSKKKGDESNKKKEVRHDLGKLCKELQYMISSFEKLKNFETNLKEPLQTLKANVDDILKDLPLVTEKELPKQVPLNLRVLRNNITRVKIQIPLQHHSANANSEANRPWQTTVATREADDLPHLYNDREIFEKSYYFKEVDEKYKELDDREKLCLLCFAIFPENAEIKKRLLRFWWVGENLLVPDKDAKDEKELLSSTLQTFVDKGLIQPVQKKNKSQPRGYKMNPIVRSCLIKFAEDARFFRYDKEGKPTMDFSTCKKACMVKSDDAQAEWFSKYLNEPGPERLQADLVKLQMLFNFPEKRILEEASKGFDKLQTLFNISKQFPALPKEWFSKMTGINVLYLGRWEAAAGKQRHVEVEDIDFLRGLKKMKTLRLLSLQGISGIPRLPKALCKLANLRILDLRACHNLEKLPEGIGALKKLTYLDLSECYLVDDMPKQLNQLKELEVLKGFVIGDGRNSCTLHDLAALEKLRKLSVNVSTPKFDIEKAGDALSNFKNLQKLKIAWGSGGLPENSSTENSSQQHSDPSTPNGLGESKKHENDAAKTKNQEKSCAPAAKPSTDNKVNRSSSAGKSKGDDKKLKGGEAKSKTVKQEDNKGQHIDGADKSVALKVSEQQDNKQQHETGSQFQAFSSVVFVKKMLRMQPKKTEDAEGLGRLVKLDLQCFPNTKQPTWLVPGKLTGLKKLSIIGGNLSQLQPVQEGDREGWKVETLRLKYLINFKMDWREMQKQFKDLKSLEQVRCPRITFCPCDAMGVWQAH